MATQTEPTVSNDPKLYQYTPADAPDDVVINIGNAALIVAAQHATSDPQRIEVGDRRRGPYYLTLIGKMPGLMPLKQVDERRVAQVKKIRDIRIGDREQDWIIEARKRAEANPQGPNPYNPHSNLTPLQRAAKEV